MINPSPAERIKNFLRRKWKSWKGSKEVSMENRLASLCQKPDAFVVQIGSNDGLTGDPIHPLMKKNPAWRGLFVEPVPELFAKLKENYGPSPRFIFENAAINAGISQPFYSVDPQAKIAHPKLPSWWNQLGSFDPEHILKAPEIGPLLKPYIRSTQVQGITLQALLAKHRVQQIDILHIDAEGFDWKILSQLDLQNIRPAIILYEHKCLSDSDRESSIRFLEPFYEFTDFNGDFLSRLKLDA
jgi:FkbM family methyltransferase